MCRFYFEDLDERRRRPRRLLCGQLAACPILWGTCSHCFRAGHTHGTYDFLFCGHTLERPGRNCLSCEARGDLHGAEGGMHVINTRHFLGGATAGNRAWSRPNRYDVMTGEFGRTDDSLETGLRVECMAGCDP